jgi:GNAT superfamily N-acetyltransferase
MALTLRHARPEERGALEDMQRRASLVYDEYRPYLLANPEVIELPLAQLAQKQVRVAELEGQVLGFSVLLPRAKVFDLDGLFVEPDYWNRGIGRALLQDAEVLARASGADAIEVLANPRAEGFYVRLGFAAIGREQTLFGPANRMRLELAARVR